LKNKLILFFTFDISLRDWYETGLLQREVKIYNALAEKGLEISFITYGDSTDHNYQKYISKIKIIPVYEKYKKSKFKIINIIKSFFIPLFFFEKIKYSNIYKTNQIWGGWVAAFSKILFGNKLIARCGYELYDFSLKQKKGRIYSSICFCASYILYKLSDKIHVATESDKNFVINRYKINSDFISIRPNWIDCKTFSYSMNSRNGKILAVGRLNDQKNFKLLLKSLISTKCTLDIVGEGDLEDELKAYCTKTELNVNFLGKINNQLLASYYQCYSLYVLCSKFEGHPKSLLEAISCGCIVIGTSVPGIKEILGNNQIGKLVNEDPDELKNAILKSLNEPRDNAVLKRASQFITDNFSFEKKLRTELKDLKTI
jgi:glycosyltransferase involved in cell wall biosynthesis